MDHAFGIIPKEFLPISNFSDYHSLRFCINRKRNEPDSKSSTFLHAHSHRLQVSLLFLKQGTGFIFSLTNIQLKSCMFL